MAIYLFVIWICVTNAVSLNNMNLSLSNASVSKNTTSPIRLQSSSSSAQIRISSTLPYDAISHRSRLLLDCSSCVFMRLLHKQALLLMPDIEQCTARKVHLYPLHPQHFDSHSKNTGANTGRVITKTDLDWAKILKQWILPPCSLVLMIPRKAFACLYRKLTTVAGFRKVRLLRRTTVAGFRTFRPLRGDQ